MLEFERNTPVDTAILADLFARCGWKEEAAGVKLGWVLAASAEWVVCKLDGELIGFGRSCRLGPIKRVVFDVLVDPRFNHALLRSQIVHLLAQNVGDLEEVSVFSQHRSAPHAPPLLSNAGPTEAYTGGYYVPPAPAGAYMGPEKVTEED